MLSPTTTNRLVRMIIARRHPKASSWPSPTRSTRSLAFTVLERHQPVRGTLMRFGARHSALLVSYFIIIYVFLFVKSLIFHTEIIRLVRFHSPPVLFPLTC